MPHKFNADRRDKIPKQKHRVTNWSEYNEGLRRRGDLTVWISEDALGLWSAPRRTTRGGQQRYSDLAIELCLTLSVVFSQPLRQTQGMMRSIAALLEVNIAVPDFSTLSRRGNGLILQAKPSAHSRAAIHLVMDSTGVTVPQLIRFCGFRAFWVVSVPLITIYPQTLLDDIQIVPLPFLHVLPASSFQILQRHASF